MRFTLSAALLFFTGIIGSYAQGYKEKFADSEYSKGHYSVALGFYKEILSEDSTDVHAEVNLADCYRRLYDYKNAEIAYKKLIDSHTGLDPEIYRYYAETLANNKKYPESEVWFKKYNQMNNADSRSQNYLQTYTKFGSISADSALYKVEITNINSTATDFGPMYYKKGLVFCSGRHLSEGVKRVFSYDQSAFLDLYYVDDLSTLRNANVNLKSDTLSTKKKEIHHHDLDHSDFSEATSNDSRTVGTYHVHKLDSSANAAVKPFDDHINSKYHEGPVTFYNGEDSMIFTRNNQLKNKVGQDAAGRTKLKLYTAVHTEKGWDKIRDLPFNNDEYSVGQPALSPDNKKLYFVSDMPGGIGGTDLYVSEYTGGQWGKPVNMGKSVNTEGNEMFPFIDHDGNMYFASNGHGGFGGLDIFFYNMNGPGKVAVKNIGTPLNSPADDFGIIIDKGKRSGYFASNRLHGGTDDNIYSF
ncbi:MAG: flagellar motor protein MotB, partial [Cytophagaceae bacterium]